MRRTLSHLAPALLFCVAITSLLGQQSLQMSDSTKPNAGNVQRITLPQVQTQIPPGPHVDVYEKNCLLCHSARYVLGQPRFSKDKWQAEVRKMVDAYGATISPADQVLIVDYLVAVKGSEPPASAPTK